MGTRLALTVAPAIAAVALAAPAQAAPVTNNLPMWLGEFAATVQEVSDQYGTGPVNLTYIPIWKHPTALAGTTYGGDIIVNSLEVPDPYTFDRVHAENVQNGHFSPGCTPQRSIALHEGAHVIEHVKDQRPASAASSRFAGQDLTGLLSRYSYSYGGYIDASEALAEAFVAVKCEPFTATWAEHELHNILVNTP